MSCAFDRRSFFTISATDSADRRSVTAPSCLTARNMGSLVMPAASSHAFNAAIQGRARCHYGVEENDLAAKIDLVWEDGWPRREELHHYRLDGDKLPGQSRQQ